MLSVRDLSLKLGGLQILNDLTFDVKERSITGLIGPNGAGKTSFFNAVFGLFSPQKGSVKLDGVELIGKEAHEVNRLGVIRSFQDARLLPQITVMENLLLSAKYAYPVTLRRVFFDRKKLREEERAHRSQAMTLLKRVGLEGKADVLAKNLSYGQTKLIEILKIFMSDSKVVFLDEPFAGLFPEMIKLITKLIRELVKSGRTIMFVEHNMKLIAEICDHVVVLDAGSKIAEGTFDAIKRNPEVIEAYLGD
ncbi:MAG: ABC transporter ATP-binding protein [Candidatus Peregrinibacteria bacterium]